MLGPVPIPKLTQHSPVPHGHWTLTAGMLGKLESGIEMGALTGPDRTPGLEATNSPVCSGGTMHTS